MFKVVDRVSRKGVAFYGFIYIGEAEHRVAVKNISITGLLVQFNGHDNGIKFIFNQLNVSTIIHFYLPEMRLASEVQVVRAEREAKANILLGLKFKNVGFDLDANQNKRKVYREVTSDPGSIFLKGHYYEFTSINVSVEGLMILLDVTIPVQVGLITRFEVKRLGLEGQIKVIWVDTDYKGRTLIGLEYVHLKQNVLLKRLPRSFCRRFNNHALANNSASRGVGHPI